jgi:putative PIN family toxin of toxin-antitoxin system
MRIAIDTNTVVSGLFFAGNERKLLLKSLGGSLTLVFAEDVVEEIYEVVQETFRDHHNLPAALELLETIFAAGELVRRTDYEEGVPEWSRRVRDPYDAPVVACAVSAEVDGIVTGDKDLLGLTQVGGIAVYRTRRLLDRLMSNE